MVHYINIFRSNNIRKTLAHVAVGSIALVAASMLYTHSPSSNEVFSSMEKGIESCISIGEEAGFTLNRSGDHFSLSREVDKAKNGYIHIAQMSSIIAACHPIELSSACIGSSCGDSDELSSVLFFKVE